MEPLILKLSKITKPPPPHEKAYWCELIGHVIHRPLGQVLGFTKDWTMEMIKDSYLTAMTRPTIEKKQKYWWWYRKQTNL